MGSGSSTPAPTPSQIYPSDLLYPTSISNLRVYINADISSYLSGNNIFNRYNSIYSLVPSTNSAITGNTGNIVRNINQYGMPYYIMNNSAVFNNYSSYIDLNIGKPMTLFAVFSFNSIPLSDGGRNKSTIFKSTKTGSKNEIVNRTLWFGYDGAGYSPSVSLYIYNTAGLYTIYATYNFNTSNDTTLFGAHNDIIIMTVTISGGTTSDRDIHSYFYNQDAIRTASLPAGQIKTTSSTTGNFAGNEKYLHIGDNPILNIYEFGLYQSNIGDINAKKMQTFFMNKYYKPIACTNISVNAGFNIITWSDGIYNSTLFSQSNVINSLNHSKNGGRIPDAYNVVFQGTSNISINIPSSLTMPSSGFTTSGTVCTYDSITKMYTLDISNSPFKFSTLAVGNYIITIQGKNNKYNLTTDISKAFTVLNPSVSPVIIRNGATTSYPYIDVSGQLNNLTVDCEVYADISYGGQTVSFLLNDLVPDASGFCRIYGNVNGIDILQNKVYNITIKIINFGKTFNSSRQTVTTYYNKPENIDISISAAGNSKTAYITWDPVADASGYKYQVEYYDFDNRTIRSYPIVTGSVTTNTVSFTVRSDVKGSSTVAMPFTFSVFASNILGGLFSEFYYDTRYADRAYSEFYYDGLDSQYRPFNILNFRATKLGEVELDINREMFARGNDTHSYSVNISISGYDSDSLSSYQQIYNLSETYSITGTYSGPFSSTRIDDTKPYTISGQNIKPNQRLTAHLRYTNTGTTPHQGELYSRTIYSMAAPITALIITKNYSNYNNMALSWSSDLSNYNQSLLTYDIKCSFGININMGFFIQYVEQYRVYISSIRSPCDDKYFFLFKNYIHQLYIYPVNGDGIANKTNMHLINIRSLAVNPNIPTISGTLTAASISTISGYIKAVGNSGDLAGLYIKYESIQERLTMSGYVLVQQSTTSGTSYPFTISGLSPSTTYRLYGASRNNDNEYTLSSPIICNTPVSPSDFTYTPIVTVTDYAKKYVRLDIRVPARLVKYYALDYSSNTVPALNRITSYVVDNTLFSINITNYSDSYRMRMVTYNYADISYAHNIFTVSGPAKLATIDNIKYTSTSISFTVSDISSAVARVFTASCKNTTTNEITTQTTTCTTSDSYTVTFNSLLTNIKYEIYVDTYPFSGSTLNTRTQSTYVIPMYMENDRFTGPITYTNTVDTYTVPNIVPGQQYDVYMAYIDSCGNRISDYSDIYSINPLGPKPSNNYSDIQVATNSEGLFTSFMYPQSSEYAIYNINVVPNSTPADSNYNSSNDTYTKRFIIYFTWSDSIKNSTNDKIGIDIYFKNSFIDVYKNTEFTNITTDTSGSITVDLSYNSLKNLYDGTNASILYNGTLTVILYHMKKIDNIFVNNPSATAINKNTSFYIL